MHHLKEKNFKRSYNGFFCYTCFTTSRSLYVPALHCCFLNTTDPVTFQCYDASFFISKSISTSMISLKEDTTKKCFRHLQAQMLLGYFLLAATWSHAIFRYGEVGLFQNSSGPHGSIFSFEPTILKVKKTTILETSNSSSRGRIFAVESKKR